MLKLVWSKAQSRLLGELWLITDPMSLPRVLFCPVDLDLTFSATILYSFNTFENFEYFRIKVPKNMCIFGNYPLYLSTEFPL